MFKIKKMSERQKEKEEQKAKKIRRILLLKIDKELKSNSNKNSNILINSKRIQDINKAYNCNKILLSETARVYSNYVEFFEKSYPSKKRQINTKREPPRRKKEERLIKSLNSSYDSSSPYIEFIPNKIDLGKRKITNGLRIAINNWNSPIHSEEKIIKENETNGEIQHKSTKLSKKGITKVINKIISIKLSADIEDDNHITKNIIKLRKYCYKLINKKRSRKNPRI